MDCIFCSIAGGLAPCRKVYEDAHTLVFMDIAEDVDGHMIAIPKQHVKNILDCDAKLLGHVMYAVQTVACHCVHSGHYDGVNLLNASGDAAGQSVPHFHIHIIPRKAKDGIDAWPRLPGAKADIDEVWKKIRLER